MSKIVAIALLGAILAVPGVLLAQEGPILLEQGTTQADVPQPIVAFPDGTELMVEPGKGPVQGIISERREVIEGGELSVYIGGLVAVQGREGWAGDDPSFYFRANGTTFENAQVEDGWHIALDEVEGP